MNRNYKILVVDDNHKTQDIIRSLFTPLNIQYSLAQSINEAELVLSSTSFDLFIINLDLTSGDPLYFLRSLRQMPHYKISPILVLSSSSDIASKLSAFSLGADDYITVPFESLEFKARTECALRRLSVMRTENDRLEAGPFILQFDKQLVLISETNENLHLTPTEFKILALLARRPEVIFTRSQILDYIWGHGVAITDRTVDSHVYTLRKKLGKFATHIQSVQGEGYRFLERIFVPGKTQQTINSFKNF